MSDPNNANETLQELVTVLNMNSVAHEEMLQALKETVIDQMSEITALCVALSATMAALPADKYKLITGTLSSMIKEHPNQELAAKLHQVLEKRLYLKLSL